VLVVHNRSSEAINTVVIFWDSAGNLIDLPGFTLAAKGTQVLNTALFAPGVGGSITVAHSGQYDALTGKTVALEPATGFSFDSPMLPRPR
jgi:hypothetical protein